MSTSDEIADLKRRLEVVERWMQMKTDTRCHMRKPYSSEPIECSLHYTHEGPHDFTRAVPTWDLP